MTKPTGKKCGRCKKYKIECKCGRPLFEGKDEDVVVLKLEEGFKRGYTDEEACLIADISPRSLYRYIEKHPSFGRKKERLKRTPNILSKDTVYEQLKNKDINTAKWNLEKTDESYNPKQKQEVDQKNLNITQININSIAKEKIDDFIESIISERDIREQSLQSEDTPKSLPRRTNTDSTETEMQ